MAIADLTDEELQKEKEKILRVSRKVKEPQYGKIYRDVLEYEGMTRNAVLAYAGLSIFADSEDRRSWPSVRTLAGLLHVSNSTLYDGMRKLEALGFLLKETSKKTGTKENEVNKYQLSDYQFALKRQNHE